MEPQERKKTVDKLIDHLARLGHPVSEEMDYSSRTDLAIRFICKELDDLRAQMPCPAPVQETLRVEAHSIQNEASVGELAMLRRCVISGEGEARVPKELAKQLGVSFLTDVRALPIGGNVKVIHGVDNFRVEDWFTDAQVISAIDRVEKDHADRSRALSDIIKGGMEST